MAFVESITNFILNNKWVLLFYLAIIIIVIIYRKKFQLENKFILMYRSDFGIDTINKFAAKNREFVKYLGYTAIGVGFIGMGVISYFLLKGLYDLVFIPNAPATMSLVIPGVQMPGSPIAVPFIYGILAIFIVVLFHEFGHGIVAAAHGIKIRNTGIVFFGPIIGAFVEPDDKQLLKKESVVQNAIFGAGPFFNVILAGLVAVVLFLILNPIMTSMVNPSGVTFDSIQKDFPADKAGLKSGITYTELNGKKITTANDLTNELATVRPNETINITGNGTTSTIVTVQNPKDETKGYLGVIGVNTKYELKNHDTTFEYTYNILDAFFTLMQWVLMLSLGIGLANLLPLGPVDGGQMIRTALVDINGKKKGLTIWVIISIITLTTLLILIFVPMFKAIFLKA